MGRTNSAIDALPYKTDPSYLARPISGGLEPWLPPSEGGNPQVTTPLDVGTGARYPWSASVDSAAEL